MSAIVIMTSILLTPKLNEFIYQNTLLMKVWWEYLRTSGSAEISKQHNTHTQGWKT